MQTSCVDCRILFSPNAERASTTSASRVGARRGARVERTSSGGAPRVGSRVPPSSWGTRTWLSGIRSGELHEYAQPRRRSSPAAFSAEPTSNPGYSQRGPAEQLAASPDALMGGARPPGGDRRPRARRRHRLEAIRAGARRPGGGSAACAGACADVDHDDDGRDRAHAPRLRRPAHSYPVAETAPLRSPRRSTLAKPVRRTVHPAACPLEPSPLPRRASPTEPPPPRRTLPATIPADRAIRRRPWRSSRRAFTSTMGTRSRFGDPTSRREAACIVRGFAPRPRRPAALPHAESLARENERGGGASVLAGERAPRSGIPPLRISPDFASP